MENCGRCDGTGCQVWDEDGRREEDVCYRCGGTGKIDEESARELRLEQVANVLAHEAVQDLRRAYDADPEGEGWAFAAAESMMTEYDYTLGRKLDMAARFGAEIASMSRDVQDALILALLPKPAKVETAVSVPPAPAPVNEDEIPF